MQDFLCCSPECIRLPLPAFSTADADDVPWDIFHRVFDLENESIGDWDKENGVHPKGYSFHSMSRTTWVQQDGL